jgi:Relaxase/Mobilisation nuclease domain
MNRGIEKEDGEAVLWQNFYGGEASHEDHILSEFETNAKSLKDRKNGNVLYHEILSISRGHSLERKTLLRSLADIGQEYLRLRAPEQLAYGVVHLETDHAHLHLMISANRVEASERVRLSRQAFAEVQKGAERYAIAKHPELKQTVIYDRDVNERRKLQGERVKGQAHEQAMKARTNIASRKDVLKMRLHRIFEEAGSLAELSELLGRENLRTYTRGKNMGVLERKHRFATLGLETHFESTLSRFAKTPTRDTHEIGDKDMSRKTRPLDPFEHKPLFMESMIEELVTNQRPDFLVEPDRQSQVPGEPPNALPPTLDKPVPVVIPVMSETEKRLWALDNARKKARARNQADRDQGKDGEGDSKNGEKGKDSRDRER